MNDILGNGIRRSCLCPEDHCQRTFRKISFFDLLIFINCIKCVHLLSLILMETLDLDIKNRVWVDLHILSHFQIISQLFLGMHFDLTEFFQYSLIIFIVQKLFKLCGILKIFLADQLFQISRQIMIAVLQPSAEGDSVCFIVEFFRINIVEWFQLRFLQDLCMKGSHTVYRISVMNINMRHMHTVILIYNSNTLITVIFFYTGIQFTDHRHKMRNHLFKICNRPFFQSLCKNGMIGISAGLSHNINGSIHVKAFFHKKTDQLRDHHGGVSIVDLNCHVVVESVEIVTVVLCFFQDQLRGIADHKILLVNTKKLACLITVIRIKEQGQVLFDIVFVKADTVADDTFIHSVCVKKMQAVAVVFISRNFNVIHDRGQGKILKRNLESCFCSCKPGILCNPWILFFLLLMVHKSLTKQTVMII